MSIVTSLNAIRDRIAKNVAPQFLLSKYQQLQSPATEAVMVNPSVVVGFMPAKTEDMLDDHLSAAPIIIVGVDGQGGSEDMNGNELDVRIRILTCSPAEIAPDGTIQASALDMRGYIDGLNIIDAIKTDLMSCPIIGNICAVDLSSPIRFGIDEGNQWPFWSFWLSLIVNTPPTPSAPGVFFGAENY